MAATRSSTDPRVPRGDDFLSPDEIARLTPAELIRRTKSLAGFIAEHAAEAERLRRPADEVWNALRRSGYFYQFVPKAFGGMGTDLESFIDATLPIAEACASTAWAAAFAAKHNWAIAHFPERVQQELWGGAFPYIVAPMTAAPPGKAERVPGGFRVTGRWKYASGVMHADWVMLGALRHEADEPPQLVAVLLPIDEAEILDTWRADGMAGTGSHDVRVENLFIPEYRSVSGEALLTGQGPGAERFPEPIYRAPMITFFAVAASVPALGAARSALRYFRERIGARMQPGAEAKQSEKPAFQLRLAEADQMVRTAELLVRDAARRFGDLAGMTPETQLQTRIAMRAQLAHAVSLCRKATLLLAEGAGTSVHMLDDPFQRAVRDVSVIAGHFGFDIDAVHEMHGRALVGLPPTTPMI